jgi:hypothetical protein
MKERRVLTSFVEGTYDFPPSFKVYRNKPYAYYVDQRCPSYCDRILWHSVPGRKRRIKQLILKNCVQVMSSDHKPITSEFAIDLRHKIQTFLRPHQSTVSGPDRQHELAESAPRVGFAAPPVGDDAGISSDALASRSKKKSWAATQYAAVPQGGFRVRITNLRAKDLMSRDMDGQADPYIVFCSPNIFLPCHQGYNPRKGASQTSVLKHRLIAEWADEDVPEIACPGNIDLEALRHCHLVVALWDHDHIGKDVSMGQSLLGLAPVVDEYLAYTKQRPDMAHSLATAPKAFALPILIHGCQHGVVRGSIQLLGPDSTGVPGIRPADHVRDEAAPSAASGNKILKKKKPIHTGCCTLQ